MVKKVYRIENLIVALIGVIIVLTDTNRIHLLWYLLCIIIPDVSLLGYLINKKIGSIIYNVIHNYALGLLLIVLATIFPTTANFLAYIGIGLIIHVGFDRFFGYGLKYEKNFKETHIQKL